MDYKLFNIEDFKHYLKECRGSVQNITYSLKVYFKRKGNSNGSVL